MTSRTKKPMYQFLLGVIVGVSALVGFSRFQADEGVLGATSNGGLPGIYNASGMTLRDGYGSALAVDANGMVIATQ